MILVIGATGHQGGVTARHLLADGHQVRALVRDPNSKAAVDLANGGAELVVGDMDDRDSLDAAVQGVRGVFSVQPALIPPDFAAGEVRRGLNVADAARDVDHLVYASVASADRATGIPHWEAKWQIEQHIRRLGVPATVLRPVAFMENFTNLTFEWPDDQLIQVVALDDIGRLAALAFAEPDQFIGDVIEFAGDELMLGQLIGKPWTASETRFAGWDADIPALRARFPWLTDFKTWSEK